MIEITEVKTLNWDAAIRGMRNPLASWDKSDSEWKQIIIDGNFEGVEFVLGPNDLDLAKRLVNAGSDHRKFMRQIFVSMDINAPLYWWKEYDTYKVGTTANSCSTMHTIHKKEFTLDDFSHEHLANLNTEIGVLWDTKDYMEQWIVLLNVCRENYIKTKDKAWWYQMIQLLPTSYNQKRTVSLNYENLRNIYHARRKHKLDEWHTLCDVIETLPYSELITE